MLKKNFSFLYISSIFIILLMLLRTGVFSHKTYADNRFSEVLNVKAGTITSNVFFDGKSLSGLSVTEAVDVVEKPLSRIKNTRYLMKAPSPSEHLFVATYRDLGISWNLNEIQKILLDAELTGPLVERYKKAKDYQASPVTLSINVSIDDAAAQDFFTSLNEEWQIEPLNAGLTNRGGLLRVIPSVDGTAYDFSEAFSKLSQDILSGNLDDSGRYYVEAAAVPISPTLTTERVEDFTILGSCTTYYFQPTEEVQFNREVNVTVAANSLNGRVYAPGEMLSALKEYSPVTSEKGYLPAGTINDGGHVDEIGGGICQVTTTLYNAALAAELKIDVRRSHSMLVYYVPPSLDAMVYAVGHSDFCLSNDTSDYIVLEAWVDPAECSINVNIFGQDDRSPDHSVTYATEVLSITPPEVICLEDPDLPLGAYMQDRSVKYRPDPENPGSPTVNSRSWRITTDGGEVTREIMNPGDLYNPSPAIYYVATDTYATVDAVWNEETQRIDVNASFFFLNGYPLSTDLNLMSEAEREYFNATMRNEMAKKGLEWPES